MKTATATCPWLDWTLQYAGTWSSKVHLPFVFIRRKKMVSTVNIGAAQQLLGNRKAGTSPNHLQMSSPPSIIINPD